MKNTEGMPHGRGLAAPESGVFVYLILSLASANIVTLTSSEVLSLEKTQNSFGFLLAYSYLCGRYEKTAYTTYRNDAGIICLHA